jgi:proteic killer suppression protein
MEVEFEDDSLRLLELDAEYTGGHDVAIVKAFRKRMQVIRAASDERDFYAMRSLNFEKLKGDRAGTYSMRLNLQWRLLLRFEEHENGKTVVVLSIADYH